METKTIAAIALASIICFAIGAVVGYTIIPSVVSPPPPPITLEFWAPFAGEEAGLWFWQNASDIFYNETGVRLASYSIRAKSFGLNLQHHLRQEPHLICSSHILEESLNRMWNKE